MKIPPVCLNIRTLFPLVVLLFSLVSGVADQPIGVAVPVTLTFPGPGFASVAVYNAQNEMIRTLAAAKAVTGGKESFTWDGTTDLGLPAVPGDYHVHGVFFTEGPKIKYVMKVGISGQPPYMTDDPNSGWGAVHGPAIAVCTNGKQMVMIFACSESPRETGIQITDLDGKILGRFAGLFPFEGRMACTMDDKNLYLALKHASYGAQEMVISKYDLAAPPAAHVLCKIPVGDNKGTSGYEKNRWIVDVQGLALQGGKLYVPVLLDNKIFIVDPVGGSILGTSDVPSPHGIASFGGNLYVLSGKNLVKLDADGKISGTPLVTGLDDPSGLAIDGQGNFYIADGGASQQVKVFSPDGKPLRQIGIAGGRPRDGIYNPAGMLDPHGLCVMPDGTVWVAEKADDYQILGAWNKAGEKVKTFYNMHWSSGQGRLSPDHTELFFGARPQDSNAGLTAYKVDLEHGTWEPYWHITQTPDMMSQEDVLLGVKPNQQNMIDMFGAHSPYLGFSKNMVQGTNGKLYLTGGDFSIWLFDPATKKVKLASVIAGNHVEKLPDGRYQADYYGPSSWFTWSDLKGDGKMSQDGVNYLVNPVPPADPKNPPLLQYVNRLSEMVLQPDLSVMMLILSSPKGAPAQWSLCRLKPDKVLPTGVPVYDIGKLEKVTDLHIPDFSGGDNDPGREYVFSGVGFMTLANNAAYVRLEPRSKVKQHLTGVDGDGWWASRNWRITPEKFDMTTGQPAWLKLGRRTPARAKPGEMYYPGWGSAGTSHGVDFYADTLSQVWAWTDDGLYLGPVYNTNVGKSIYDANSLFVELTGAFVYDINDKTYILAGDHGISVHELKLPQLTPVDGGSVTLTAAQSAQAKPWDPDGPAPGKRPVYIAKGIFDFDKPEQKKGTAMVADAAAQKSTRVITIDGKLDPAEWSGIPEMPIYDNGKKVGTVQVTFDKTNLYLAYNITDPNGLKNDGRELPYAPFATGSYVDFNIAPDWQTPDRDKPVEGDVRVILARITGSSQSNYQMGFWAVKQDPRKYGHGSKPTPQDISSPVAQRHFDDIEPVPGLTFAYQVTDKGYTLEASVPFESLGINPARQPVVGFDASVAFSDMGGESRDRASHWAGQTEAAVVDRPGSAELKPQTWGTLEFDRTPLSAVVSTATTGTVAPK